MFLPLGLFITYYIKNKSFIIPVLLSLLISCSIEFAQSAIGRTSDIDDVILNTVGGFLGYYLYTKSNNLIERLPKFIKNQLFLDILSIFIIFILIYLLLKFEFWRFF